MAKYLDGTGLGTLWSTCKSTFYHPGNLNRTDTPFTCSSLQLNATANPETGIYFRNEYATTERKYNCSILAHDHNGDTADGLSINGYDGVSFCTGSNTRQERAIITRDGYVGIGTTSPSYLLHVNGNIGANAFVKINGTSSQFLKADGSVDSTVYFNVANDGSGSGLDADLLDGNEGSFYRVCGMRNLIPRGNYDPNISGYRWTPGKKLISGSLNRIGFSNNSSTYHIAPYNSEGPYGYYSISFWYKVTNYISGSVVSVDINDMGCGSMDVSSNRDWTFWYGSCKERTDSSRYGFCDFEGTYDATIIISDIVVVRGTNISQTWFPAPEDLVDIYSNQTIGGTKTFSDQISGTVTRSTQLVDRYNTNHYIYATYAGSSLDYDSMSYLCGWCSNNEIRAVPKSIYSLSSHNHDSSYLKLTGGTITSPDEHGFTIKRDHASYGPYIKFMNQSGVMGWIGFSAINNAVVMNNDWTGFYKIWHEGNFNPSNYSTTTHNHDSSYLTITTDQTVSGKKTYNVGKLAFGGNESNEIVNTHFANGAISTDGSSAFNGYNSIKNALSFTWYDTCWLLGNIRGSSSNSDGFGIALKSGDLQHLCFRVDTDGLYYKANNVVLHSGNYSIYCAPASHSHSYLPLTGGTLSGSLAASGRISCSDLFVNAFDNNETGIYFRTGFTPEYGSQYNCSILAYDHNNGGASPDGISINGYDGVSICTGSNARNERLRVDGDGNVGIGTSSPGYKLDVNGSLNATTIYQNGTQVSVNGHTHSYLPLSGGTITGKVWWTNGDANLKIYGVDGGYNCGDETVAIQTSFDGSPQDPETSTYTTLYASRCFLALQPRGGVVGIGLSTSSGNWSTGNEKLIVNGDVVISGELRGVSITNASIDALIV